jgi:hypothetical protein
VPLIVWLIWRHIRGCVPCVRGRRGGDAVDGFLARQLNLRSDRGAYDPIADKALLVSIYVASRDRRRSGAFRIQRPAR